MVTRWTWTIPAVLMMAAVRVVSACGGESAGQGTVDAPVDQDLEIFVPEAVQFDAEEDVAPDTVDIWEPPKPGEFGYPCDEALDCNSLWCVQTADGRQCTRTCTDSCPAGYDCREAPGTDAVFVCMPRFLNLCDPCREAADCNAPGTAGNYCLAYGAKGRFCGARCNTDPDCPGGYVCRNVPVGGGAEAKQCVPVDGEECKCSPFAKQLQKATTCFEENTHGKCEGTRFCLQSGLSLCDAKTPFPESCNGLDDNCNSVTDEFPPDYACLITNDIGSCPGRGTCVDGVESCEGNAPKLDNNCDGIDDDCDGETDEDACNDGNPCTRDTCATTAGGDLVCTHTNDNTRLCDDGSVCTQVDKCQDGQCVGFNPLSCNDGNPCTTDICDPVAGCLTSFNTDACEDGNPCTVNDRCNQGVCVSGGLNSCDDGNECTNDSCVAEMGCRNEPKPNGLACTRAGLNQCQRAVCQNGACVAQNIESTPQNPTICSRSGACSEGYCAAGTCRPLPGSACERTVQLGFCSDRVPGICTVNGDCVAQTPPQCVGQCGGCQSFCGPVCGQLCVCLDFIFGP